MRQDLLTKISAIFMALAGAWPGVVCVVRQAFMSPIDRLLSAHGAWCGAPTQPALTLLGHCPACWTGALSFVAAAALARFSLKPRPQRVRR
ncbi:MAG TPA: hypothetical protein VG943_05480 [Caulobacterales bacterium]|nr:hypothetical protein [Caulobacterales bacterium]